MPEKTEKWKTENGKLKKSANDSEALNNFASYIFHFPFSIFR